MTSHAVLIEDGSNIPCESGNRCQTFVSQACSSPQSRCQYPTERKTHSAVLPGMISPQGSKHGQISTGRRNRTVTEVCLAIHISGITISCQRPLKTSPSSARWKCSRQQDCPPLLRCSTGAACRIRPKHDSPKLIRELHADDPPAKRSLSDVELSCVLRERDSRTSAAWH
jgi:hypothetical protein